MLTETNREVRHQVGPTTKEFMALAWLATHYGRPGTPTDQAWIESLFGHLKGEHPHLEQIEDIDVW